jgi:hypothetical protein
VATFIALADCVRKIPLPIVQELMCLSALRLLFLVEGVMRRFAVDLLLSVVPGGCVRFLPVTTGVRSGCGCRDPAGCAHSWFACGCDEGECVSCVSMVFVWEESALLVLCLSRWWLVSGCGCCCGQFGPALLPADYGMIMMMIMMS